jgi:CBS domain-containing protein
MHAATQMVSELVRQPVITVGAGASVGEVLALAQSKGIHHVPIVQGSKLLGLVCTCDVSGAEPEVRALQLARRNVITALPNASAREAAALMIRHAVGSVLVANRDGLWGIVTRRDLAGADAELAALLAESRCSLCGKSEHLRSGWGESLLCVTCAERASATHWYEEVSSAR